LVRECYVYFQLTASVGVHMLIEIIRVHGTGRMRNQMHVRVHGARDQRRASLRNFKSGSG